MRADVFAFGGNRNMAMHLPLPERDVPACRSLDVLAPRFRAGLEATLAEMPDAKIVETLRTPQRQSFLYGFGRDYDDGRGIVTQAPTSLTTFHGYALGCDVVHAEHEWSAPKSWFAKMGAVAEKHGLRWGGRWRHPDLPHLFWGRCPASPTAEDRALYRAAGALAVWRKYAAD